MEKDSKYISNQERAAVNSFFLCGSHQLTLLFCQENPHPAIEMIHEEPITVVEGRTAMTGGGPTGHPVEFLNLVSLPAGLLPIIKFRCVYLVRLLEERNSSGLLSFTGPA